MGRRRNTRPFSVQERVRMFREREKKRKEQSDRVNSYLQQQLSDNLNVSDPLEESAIDNDMNLQNKLRDWANSYHISKRAINDLLSILHSNGMRNLPKNFRTLQKTPLTIELVNIAGGKLWYKGVGNCLKTIFPNLSQNITISLNFNIDGLPLFNSSKTCFWPILASIHEMPHVKPMVVSIWSGEGKPTSSNDYLKPFVEEMTVLLADGIIIDGHQITILFRCFICDSPARAFVKCNLYTFIFCSI